MTNDELKETVRLHKMWRAGEDGGRRADLSEADLSFSGVVRNAFRSRGFDAVSCDFLENVLGFSPV